MRHRLAEALAEGASGFSTGLYYPANIGAPERKARQCLPIELYQRE